VSLGSFATAAEAALCVARTPEGQAVAAARAAAAAPLTIERRGSRQAQAEELTLLVADNGQAVALVLEPLALAPSHGELVPLHRDHEQSLLKSLEYPPIDAFVPEVTEFITRHTAYNKHDTGWFVV
jgi:hypothetical protein